MAGIPKAKLWQYNKVGVDIKYEIATDDGFKFIMDMVEEEQVPKSMKNSYLTKIFKKKGNPSDIKCNRFIHNKDWFSKLTEKCEGD